MSLFELRSWFRVRQHGVTQHEINFPFQREARAGGETCKAKWLHVAIVDTHREQHLSMGLDKSPTDLESNRGLAALINIGRDFEEAAGH